MICIEYRLTHLIKLVLVECLEKKLYLFSRHSTKTKLVECPKKMSQIKQDMICIEYRPTHLIELVLVECPEEELHLDSLLKPSSLLVRLWVNYLRKII